jgi:hypothetical protein
LRPCHGREQRAGHRQVPTYVHRERSDPPREITVVEGAQWSELRRGHDTRPTKVPKKANHLGYRGFGRHNIGQVHRQTLGSAAGCVDVGCSSVTVFGPRDTDDPDSTGAEIHRHLPANASACTGHDDGVYEHLLTLNDVASRSISTTETTASSKHEARDLLLAHE